jgi:hypothetical protein
MRTELDIKIDLLATKKNFIWCDETRRVKTGNVWVYLEELYLEVKKHLTEDKN